MHTYIRKKKKEAQYAGDKSKMSSEELVEEGVDQMKTWT